MVAPLKNFLRLKDFFVKNKMYYIIGILFLIITDLLQLFIPRLLGNFTDLISDGSLERGDILFYISLITILALFIAIFRYLWRVYIFGTARRLEFELRNTLFKHLQKQSANFYNQSKIGDLMAHATNDLNAVRMAMGPGLILAVDTLFLTTTTIFIMFQSIDFRLTAFALLPLPFLALIVTRFGKSIHGRFKSVQQAFSGLTEQVQENFSGIRVIKSFVQEDQEIKNFSKANQNLVDKNMNLIRLWGLFFPLIQFISAISYMIVLGYGGRLVIYNQISLGDFIAFNSYLGLLTWPIMAIGWIINLMQRGAASMERINKILDTLPEIEDAEETMAQEKIRGEILFKDLTFSYDERPILKKINLHIRPGETLAIVGHTGSGKTTLVNLLLRVYEPEEGQIFIDGHEIHTFPLPVLRENTGYVPQDDFLFSRRLRDNISFGINGEKEEDLIKVSKIAQLYKTIEELPQGFNTLLGERGVTLSGGQRQRVAIARALIKDPTILILDDSLSAVDTQTEENILEGLRSFMRDRTTILISHRISTLKEADIIIVLDHGEIKEKGEHEELLALKGLYYELYKKQLLEEKIAQSH